ncbi:MAG: sulfotransferase family protein [Acidimicrobiales bacterium]
MSTVHRPPPIVLDDLAHPRFTDDVRAVLDLMADAGAGLSLEPEALMDAAKAETGLDDFGSDDFLPRLDVLCRCLREEARLNDAGVLAQSAFLTGLLRNRLLLEDLITRHPEILDEKVERPIVICGLPRTGTTHLHNLISSDPALRSLPYWESLEPVLADRERPPAGQPDPRLARTETALAFIDAAMPEFKRMHEMTVEHVHEEIQLLAIDFSTMLFDTIAPMPTWRDHYLARDQGPSYAYLKKILQALQWLRGGSRWVLKSPQHLEQFPALLATFPDATFVVTHRDPVSVTASMVTMVSYSARMGHDPVDTHGIADYWVDRLQRMLRACAESRDLLPADHSIDLHFDAFMKDDVAMVRRLYELADQPFTEASSSAMTTFMRDHPRGRHGGVLYDLSAFGIDREPLREAFGFYIERFAVSPEG